MKILLIGEYNRAHRNIKKGLESLGHKAIVVSTTDGFKKVDVDIEIKEYFNSPILNKVRVLIFKLTKINLLSELILQQIKSKKKELSSYDIIQLINESPFNIEAKSHIKILKWLQQWNNAKLFLLSCGLDYPSVSYAHDKRFRYSILTPYFEGKVPEKDHSLGLRYMSPSFKVLNRYVYQKIEGVISNDMDYYIPLEGHPKHLGMIPHAIDLSELTYKTPIIEDKIIIFHGINTANYYKKGNDLFEAALAIIAHKYEDKVEIIIAQDLPYKDYIKSFDKAHILLDQVYAYDQGYNALEAMAKGKVVLTGAEQEWLDYFNIKEDTIAINALPDAEKITQKLEWLILNPEKIIEISTQGRKFVEEHHDHIACAKQYLKIWSSNS
ncbi:MULTISPECIES: glycosyltransferase [Winogradskyella]|uniref:glycosyltransferase n=1 Tax=Winogradskyella TaxID=286104 RepID=UPI0015C9A781|nr:MULTISPECIES: glycosyltransferase [Winogradskyella]QXP79769.1 glycosyltransferase [Winogradskyella sp. HaHa_3_26]